MSDLIVGIDLGTTNSEIAAFVDGCVQVLGPGETRMLPSCVGFSPSGELLVGEAARHQQLLYPERTVRSIKRKMGSTESVHLDGKSFSPPEISALILRELVEWAHRRLGRRPEQRGHYGAGLLLRRATERDARGGRPRRVERGPHPQRADRGQPGLRLPREDPVTPRSSTTWVAARSTSRW